MPFAGFARGHISPTTRVKLAPATALVPATGPLPERCVDGRGPVIGSLGASPCLPGAFLAPTLALADGEAAKDTETLVGTTRRSGEADMRGAATRLVEIMRASGFQPRMHTGPTPGGGCGAIDALPDILALTHEPGIFPAAGALGLPEPTPVTHTGAATFLYELVEEQALAGRHAESFIVINRAPGMTVDRTALPCAVFWVDAWALDTTADYLADRCGIAAARARAVLSAFTTATLAVLCAGDMPVKIIEHG